MSINIYYPKSGKPVPHQFVAQGTYDRMVFRPHAVVVDLKSLAVYVGDPYQQCHCGGAGTFWSFFFDLPKDKADYCLIVFDQDNQATASVAFNVAGARRAARGTVTINFPLDNQGVPRNFIANVTCTGCDAADGNMVCNGTHNFNFDETSIGNPGGGDLFTVSFNITETPLHNNFVLTVSGTGAGPPSDTSDPVIVNNL